MVFVPIFGKAGAKVVRRHVHAGSEGGGENHHATRLEQARKFIQRMGGFRDMLQHLATEDGVEAGVRRGYVRDVADQIDAAGVP